MVVAIDGPAASGKSTVAGRTAAQLGWAFVNSGQMYRSITYKALVNNLIGQPQALIELAKATAWGLKNGRLIIDGRPPGPELNTDAVDKEVSAVSAIGELRNLINAALRRIAQCQNIVVEGRDICSVVFPDTKLKFYIDASITARARRRFQQGSTYLSMVAVQQSVAKRDQADRAKTQGALRVMPDAEYIDSSNLTIDEVCDRVLASIHRTLAAISGVIDRNEH